MIKASHYIAIAMFAFGFYYHVDEFINIACGITIGLGTAYWRAESIENRKQRIIREFEREELKRTIKENDGYKRT
jgi:uncharacterized membrane protein